jgi:hypothetical protein
MREGPNAEIKTEVCELVQSLEERAASALMNVLSSSNVLLKTMPLTAWLVALPKLSSGYNGNKTQNMKMQQSSDCLKFFLQK